MHNISLISALLISFASASQNATVSLSLASRPADIWAPHSRDRKGRYVSDPRGSFYTDGFDNWFAFEGKIVQAGPYRSVTNKEQLFQRDFDGYFVPLWVFPEDPRLGKTYDIVEKPGGRYSLGVDGRFYEKGRKGDGYTGPDGSSCTKSMMNVFHYRESEFKELGARGHMASIRGVSRRR